MNLDAEFALARKRIWLAILRTIHFEARSMGQKRRWAAVHQATESRYLSNDEVLHDPEYRRGFEEWLSGKSKS